MKTWTCGQLFVAAFLFFLQSLAVASEAHSRLSNDEAETLAYSAAPIEIRDAFKIGVPYFDPVTQVWAVHFEGKYIDGENKNFLERFTIFVYDSTSRAEVGCKGLTGMGAAIGSSDLPAEVRPFVAKSEHATALICANINGDGRPDFVLVKLDDAKTTRTIQILLRSVDGQLMSVATNSRLFPPEFDFNGSSSFVYENVLARRGKLSFSRTDAGAHSGSTITYYFEQSPMNNFWLLTRVQSVLFGNEWLEEGSHNEAWRPKDFGRITFAEAKGMGFDDKPVFR